MAIAVLLAIAIAPATLAQDTAPAELLELTLSPTVVDGELLVTVRMTEEFAGVSSGEMHFKSPSAQQDVGVAFNAPHRTSGDQFDGAYENTAWAQEHAEDAPELGIVRKLLGHFESINTKREINMAGEETKHWDFHHLGVIVSDISKTIDFFSSLGFVDVPQMQSDPVEPLVWDEIVSYGEIIMKDGKLVSSIPADTALVDVTFCSIGSMTLELVQPGGAFREVNGDFLERVGEGVDHIAYTVDVEHFDDEVMKMKDRGLDVLLSGRQANGGEFVYFDTRKSGGIIVELMKEMI